MVVFQFLREPLGKVSIKKKHFFMEFSITGGEGFTPYPKFFFVEKNIFFKNIFKDAQKLLIHPEMLRLHFFGCGGHIL